MSKTIRDITKHSVHNGVQIYKETIEGVTYFQFEDRQGYWHKRNPAKKGGTLANLKADIDWYIKNNWV